MLIIFLNNIVLWKIGLYFDQITIYIALLSQFNKTTVFSTKTQHPKSL